MVESYSCLLYLCVGDARGFPTWAIAAIILVTFLLTVVVVVIICCICQDNKTGNVHEEPRLNKFTSTLIVFDVW